MHAAFIVPPFQSHACAIRCFSIAIACVYHSLLLYQHVCHAWPDGPLVAYELKIPGPCFLFNAVFLNLAYLLIDDDTSYVKEGFTLRDLFHLVDCVCCYAILLTIVLSIKRLRESNLTYGTVGFGR